MPLALGIDTGGTYTDGVLLDLNTGEVQRKAKAFTTRGDLSVGIRECLNEMRDLDPGQVRLVSLSTTLATNAIVEGRGCKVGVLLIGHEPAGRFPAEQVAVVEGGHDIKGRPMANLDVEGVRRAAAAMRGEVDTLAISGYLSIRNPEHEELARRVAAEAWDVPAVCAHQLTTALGFYERTVTACLNAQLLPIIAELLAAVKGVLKEKGIRAPLMVVKGDGSLMSEEMARERPIETILSGPAASIVGATFLTGVESALVLDMGGTTTDIAILEGGRPRLNREGAVVGGWRTRVEAAEISTFGVGGDSFLQVSRDCKLQVGPRRVWPLSATAARFHCLAEELAGVDPDREVMDGQPVDCWMLVKRPGERSRWSDGEWRVIQALADGAHNIFTLAERAGRDPNLLPLKGLEQAQVIGRISFTPTDVLHALGRFTAWDARAAVAGARLQARRMHKELDDFLAVALREIEGALKRTIVQSLVYREGLSLDLAAEAGAGVFLERFISGKPRGGFGVQLTLDYPIVAIGAPVPAYLPAVGEAFHTEVFIPTHAEVANAVGAAAGQVVETVQVLIKPGTEGGFVVHAPWEMAAFLHLEEAEGYVLEKARAVALHNARRAGAADPEVLVEKKDLVSHTAGGNDEIFLETSIQVTAVGRPRWEE